MKVLFLNPQQEMGGIQCLSAFLKQAGHETTLVNDPNLFDNPWIQYPWVSALLEDSNYILNQIETYAPDLIALSMVTDDYKWALKWAGRIKERLRTPIVVGNVHPTFHPKDVLYNDAFDFAVRGEGELTLLELAEALAGQREMKDVLGLAYKDASGVHVNEMRPLIEDLDILPFPDKDLYYDVMPYLNHGYTTMSGRGCPYRCTFCDNNTSMQLYKESVTKTQKWTRRHSPEYVVNEILWAKERYGIKHVRFNDEDFSYDKRWLREFCPLYKEKVGIPYFAWVYPNTIDDEMAQLLAESGCDAVEMGIQSGAEHLRKEVLHRKTKDTQIVEAMRSLRKFGIRTTVDVIIGLPTETKADLDATVRLLADGKPWHLYAFWLRYYPSTEILSIAKERKLLTPEQIYKLENAEHTRGHIAGGTALEQDQLSRSYHAFIVLLPLMPRFLIHFFLERDLIRHFPSFLSPFLMVNVTKMIKRDRFNEFRVRGWRMLWVEGWALVRRTLARNLGAVVRKSPRPRKIGERMSFLLYFALSLARAESFAGKAEMNGIRYSDYAGFDDKWKFVTVRYRTDSGEQRFVWANPAAQKALGAGGADFPDGSVFAKIGFMTEEDPAFKSSRVPSGSLRYQFMVRDKAKYASTGGWGYALFDANKTTLEGNPEYQAQACFACHQLVPERGQVFSVPLKISPFVAKATTATKDEFELPTSVKFKTMPLAQAPALVRKSLPSVKNIRAVTGEVTKHVFRGTIDEIRPSLIDEVRRTGKPAALIGEDRQQFSAVYPDSARKNCPAGKSLKAVFSTNVPSSAPGSAPFQVVAWQDLCL